jgi:hypothetical protein
MRGASEVVSGRAPEIRRVETQGEGQRGGGWIGSRADLRTARQSARIRGRGTRAELLLALAFNGRSIEAAIIVFID